MSSYSRRILVVDDDPASCELVAYFLKSLGYTVAIAPDGGRALNMSLRDDVELVIVGAHMPALGGPEVVTMLRARPMARRAKFLALTADESEEIREAMRSSGADGFLTKPVDIDLLRKEVLRLVPGTSQSEGPLHRRARELQVRIGWQPIDPRAELAGGDD